MKDKLCCIQKPQKRLNFLEHRKRKSWKRKADAALQETVGKKQQRAGKDAKGQWRIFSIKNYN
ncbi:hypothetical protein CTM61_02470 [Prevotella intermedia]|uniref:hypothetical protein n=1 Tax=Prevotella intermedia TaxID=28131 RepID=UPI000C1C169C|nr:hypothetical protein [Prevotella intermedia]ATV54386.1 hypothetical protein CTM61_02470 [Prevotella intermedia]